jgi:hypothetical protein
MSARGEAAAGATANLSRWARYHRHLEDGDFSLEANTDSVPEAGHFYLLRAGPLQVEVLLRSDDFPTAEAAYHHLCREHWECHLTSPRPSQRLASAWGLLGLEPANQAAAAVIERDGRPGDRERLTRMRNRRRYDLKRGAHPSQGNRR